MKGFNFEKDLQHQKQAVDSTIAVFENLRIIEPTEVEKNYVNPVFDWKNDIQYQKNIEDIKYRNEIKETFKKTNIIDIMMETGTGKTYTYTKTIFELNKNFGIFKFIIVVPTLSIKAGTINFLKSDSCREHFKEQYGKTLRLHIVESQKFNKSKKQLLPPAIIGFVNAGRYEKDSIQVMIVNAGMINSETMQKSYDKNLLDKYSKPFDAIASTNPFNY
jgi:type III restriction enzyme